MQYIIQLNIPLFQVSVTSRIKNIQNNVNLTSTLRRFTDDSQSSVKHEIVVSNAKTVGHTVLVQHAFCGSFDWLLIADSKPEHLSLKEAIVPMLVDHVESVSAKSPQIKASSRNNAERMLRILDSETKQIVHKKEDLEVEILPLFPTESRGDEVSIQEVRNHIHQSLRRASVDIKSDTDNLIDELLLSKRCAA